jgi:hypothetical protein
VHLLLKEEQTVAEIKVDARSGKPVSLLSYVEAVRREQKTKNEVPSQKKSSVPTKLHSAASKPKSTLKE